MTIVRAQCSWQIDTAAPTDVMVITPHFKVVGGPIFPDADYLQLATDLANGLVGMTTLQTKLTVKMYDAQGAKPNYPLATYVKSVAGILPAGAPRELAVCLSYYAGTNRPRRRGRLYYPACLGAIPTNVPYVSSVAMTFVAQLVPILTGLGGINVDWVVYSVKDGQSFPVTDWWIDNAWDVQRRRGAKSTTRQIGTTTEASAPNIVGVNPADHPPYVAETALTAS